MQRTRKAEVIETLETEFKSASSMIVADYRGLSVSQLAQVRNDLRGLDARFQVLKNTLGRIAAERADVADVEPLLKGPTAVAFCRSDPAPVAKRLNDVARETRVLVLRGGLVEGRVLDADAVRTLATLPSREVLIAQLLGRPQRADLGVRQHARGRAARPRGRARPGAAAEGAGGLAGRASRNVSQHEQARSTGHGHDQGSAGSTRSRA